MKNFKDIILESDYREPRRDPNDYSFLWDWVESQDYVTVEDIDPNRNGIHITLLGDVEDTIFRPEWLKRFQSFTTELYDKLDEEGTTMPVMYSFRG